MVRISVGPATRAITALPVAWAMSNQMPATTYAANDEASADGPSAAQLHRSRIQSKPNPQNTPKAASIQRDRSGSPIIPAVATTSPQASICHGVHGPCPRKTLDATAAV